MSKKEKWLGLSSEEARFNDGNPTILYAPQSTSISASIFAFEHFIVTNTDNDIAHSFSHYFNKHLLRACYEARTYILRAGDAKMNKI